MPESNLNPVFQSIVDAILYTPNQTSDNDTNEQDTITNNEN